MEKLILVVDEKSQIEWGRGMGGTWLWFSKREEKQSSVRKLGKKTDREATDRPQTAVKLTVYILVYFSRNSIESVILISVISTKEAYGNLH